MARNYLLKTSKRYCFCPQGNSTTAQGKELILFVCFKTESLNTYIETYTHT